MLAIQLFLFQRHANENPFICPICGKCFKTSYRLKEHKRTHRGIKHRNIYVSEGATRRIRKDRPPPSNKPKERRCFLCHEIFTKQKLLVEHLKSIHNHEIFRCEQCLTSFETKQLLAEHVEKIHKLTCKRCLLKCDNADTFNEHFETHANDPTPFRCRICGKGVKHGNYLNEHMMVRILLILF